MRNDYVTYLRSHSYVIVVLESLTQVVKSLSVPLVMISRDKLTGI